MEEVLGLSIDTPTLQFMVKNAHFKAWSKGTSMDRLTNEEVVIEPMIQLDKLDFSYDLIL